MRTITKILISILLILICLLFVLVNEARCQQTITATASAEIVADVSYIGLDTNTNVHVETLLNKTYEVNHDMVQSLINKADAKEENIVIIFN